MEESKNPQSTGAGASEKHQEPHSRDAEATSRETLSDVEKSQEISGTKQGTTSSESGATDNSSSAPSPDGAFDGSRGESGDGRNTGGPM